MASLKAIQDPAFLAQFLEDEIYVLERLDRPGSLEQTEITAEEVTPDIAVVVPEADRKHVQLLENILGAIGLDLESIQLVYSSGHKSHSTLAESSKVLSFGVQDVQSPVLSIQTKYALTTVEETAVIMADGLSELEKDRELKKKLWTCLQQAFPKTDSLS